MSKVLYYTKFWLKYLTNSFDNKIPNENYTRKYRSEVDYYCRVNRPFKLTGGIMLNELNLLKNSGYTYDLYNILHPFRKKLKFNFISGDVTTVPECPTFVKSRPIKGENDNSVLLPLDSKRHFRFVDDKVSFSRKLDGIVWRGAAYQSHRLCFLKTCSDLSFIDAGNTARSKENDIPYAKPKMSIKEQLKFKFILSLEGNDVATNLKWIMSSNSVCIMPRPKFETWFKEGTLIPNYHYIEIKDDFSDLSEKYNKYIKLDKKCADIIKNANDYVSEFYSLKKRIILARAVCLKYHEYNELYY